MCACNPGSHSKPCPIAKKERAKVRVERDSPPEVESVFFVPHTPHSKLAKMLQELEDRMCIIERRKKLRVVERRGNKMIDMVSKADPWEEDFCFREGCLVCVDTIEEKVVEQETEQEDEGW